MQYLKKLTLLLMCALTLSGCNPDMFVSQTPQMSDFIGRTPEHIYTQAMRALSSRQYSRAISVFKAFVKLYPDHKEAESVHLELIHCYTARGQFKEALKEVEVFKDLYPKSAHCDTVKKKEALLRYKAKMDRSYHSAWLKDIKAKNKGSYHGLIKRLTIKDS